MILLLLAGLGYTCDAFVLRRSSPPRRAHAASSLRMEEAAKTEDGGLLSVGEKVGKGLGGSWANPMYWNRQFVTASHISNNIPPNSKVIELGKDSKNLYYLSNSSAVTLIVPPSNVEVSEGPLREAAANLNLDFVLYTERALDTIPILPKTFDAALCCDMLDGAPEQAVSGAISLLGYSLKSGGRLLFVERSTVGLPQLAREFGFSVEHESEGGYDVGIATRRVVGTSKSGKKKKAAEAVKPAAATEKGFGAATPKPKGKAKKTAAERAEEEREKAVKKAVRAAEREAAAERAAAERAAAEERAATEAAAREAAEQAAAQAAAAEKAAAEKAAAEKAAAKRAEMERKAAEKVAAKKAAAEKERAAAEKDAAAEKVAAAEKAAAEKDAAAEKAAEKAAEDSAAEDPVAAAAKPRYQVVVPEGLGAGGEMAVAVDGKELIIVVPEGYLAGMTIEFELPVVGIGDKVEVAVEVEDEDGEEEEEEVLWAAATVQRVDQTGSFMALVTEWADLPADDEEYEEAYEEGPFLAEEEGKEWRLLPGGEETGQVAAVAEAAPAGIERMQITIPEGVQAGDAVRVMASWGGEYEIVVPEGLSPGDPLEFDVPAAPSSS